ncbi:T9SS type A sorting domain-containing protein [Tellurirhabdus bombi]|uniref:T9SS type A sorting domain-containing protein n=1 Tax=Tellurirhabdus bombi TaxID=2907205 RepID=UPI001F433205|nr:T9SS type A sorting domain-containing protein [Tellurirhabdus bombi]
MKRLLPICLICLLWVFSAGSAFACSCMDGGPFLSIAEKSAWQPGILMVRAEVKSQEEHGMDVKVLEVLHGAENKNVIRVWGDPGHLCRLYTHGFKKGEKLVLILRRLETPYYGNEQVNDYELGGCGTYVLREGDRISGRISARDGELSKNKFYDELHEILNRFKPEEAKVYPNPVSDQLTVDMPDTPDTPLSLQVFSVTGQRLRTMQLSEKEQHDLDFSTLAAGQYILFFSSEHQRYQRRVIKQ